MPSSLRIALVSDGTLFDEWRVRPGASLHIGDGRGTAFACPGVDAPRHELVSVHRDNAIVQPTAGMQVRLEESGQSRPGDPRDAIELAGDQRVTLTVGGTSIYAWWVEDAPVVDGRVKAIAWALGAAAMASLWVHAVVWLLAMSTIPTMSDVLQFDTGPRVARLIMSPPPEPLVEVPTAEAAASESQSAAAGGLEGVVGRDDAEADDTALPDHDGPLVDRAPESDLGSALSSAIGVSGALSNVFGPSDDYASNFGTPFATAGQVDVFVMGPGPGGLGLRGPGPGGGRDGLGRVGGVGEIDTGSGHGERAALEVRDERERRAEVVIAQPTVAGFLPAEHIRRVVQRHGRGMRHCYETALQQDRELAGRVTVTWTVGLDGRVQSVTAGENTLGDRRVESCVLEEVRRMRFDAPDGGQVVVTFPFSFRSVVR